MKTAISIPDRLFKAAEGMAAKLGVSRSEFYQRAIARYLENLSDAAVTAELDVVYQTQDKWGVDPVLDALQRASIVREGW